MPWIRRFSPMNRGKFSPVTIDLPADRVGRYRNVTSAAEAAELLIGRWPSGRGPKYVHALEVCLAVLEGHTPAEAARSALVEAAKEVDVYVRG
ncbi:DUF982 domain-containing protein [Mesorhizobium sp. RMAD-H1]|uniref:DUF982 domain-containing protein n=1 Tax=Mesorhizobium sp. RMAD-H1 TaxID=2587065 RepID=UPI0032B2B437